MSKEVCPFDEGDRVDHKLFGLGTAVGAPVAMVGTDLHSSTLVELADQLEQQLAAGPFERQVAQFIDGNEIVAQEFFG